MPYSKPADAPSYVPKEKRAQWIAVFNSAWEKAKSEGKSDKDADESAFAQANGVAGPNAKAIAASASTETREIFAPITKMYDGPDGFFVEGVMVAEEPDRVREIWDYASSKSSIVQWASDFSRVTAGKSVGNLRSMHGQVASGKFVVIDPDDGQKLVRAKAQVIDAAEIEKCRAGVYTGFSLKAPYAKKWTDPVNPRYTRWTSGPIIESSLVDLPCIPGAVFNMKITGVSGEITEETRRFAHYQDVNESDLDALAARVAEKLAAKSNEEEVDMDIKAIAEKYGLDPAKFSAALGEAAVAAKAAEKCSHAAKDCMDGDCADHKDAADHGAKAKKAADDAAAAQKRADDADAAAKRADAGVALKAADIRAILADELTKALESAIAAKMAPMESNVNSLTQIIARISGTVIPSAVAVREGTDSINKGADGASDAAKAAGVKAVEDAEKLAKAGKPVEGIKAIHAAGPAVVMTNRGIARA